MRATVKNPITLSIELYYFILTLLTLSSGTGGFMRLVCPWVNPLRLIPQPSAQSDKSPALRSPIIAPAGAGFVAAYASKSRVGL